MVSADPRLPLCTSGVCDHWCSFALLLHSEEGRADVQTLASCLLSVGDLPQA
jgi:hypothetical protein